MTNLQSNYTKKLMLTRVYINYDVNYNNDMPKNQEFPFKQQSQSHRVRVTPNTLETVKPIRFVDFLFVTNADLFPTIFNIQLFLMHLLKDYRMKSPHFLRKWHFHLLPTQGGENTPFKFLSKNLQSNQQQRVLRSYKLVGHI